MKNNDKNFDENNLEKNNKTIIISNSNSKINRKYKNIFLCPINKHDIVTSIDILDDIVIYGTIMGNVYLYRVNQNNLSNKIKKDNLSDSNNSLSHLDIHKNNKSDDISKISCIKLNENNNKSFNNNEIKNNNIYFSSDIYPTTKNMHSKDKEQDINTKIKLLNKNILENKNFPLDNSIIHQKSLISKSSSISSLINTPKFTQLISNAEENIPCLSFDTKDKINVAIGDSDILRFENILENNIFFTQIKNYNSENEHIKSCEGAMCFMSKNNFLKLDTKINDNSTPIELVNYEYTNKTIINFGINKGEINAYNYLVPFDFDGDRLLFLDYESENIRRICIYHTLTKKAPFIKKITKDFGHISFMKFLLNNKLILCRKNKFCEIRDLINDFKLVDSWEHIGDEIIAMNLYIKKDKNENEEDDKNENSMTELSYKINEPKDHIEEYDEMDSKKNKYSKNKNKYGFDGDFYGGLNTKLNIKKYTSDKDKINNSTFRELIKLKVKKQFKSNMERKEISIYNKKSDIQVKENITNELYNKKNIDLLTINNNEYYYDKEKKIFFPVKQKNNSNEKNISNEVYIITVDKNGSFNRYHNGKINTIFNLYEINNIEQNYKDEEFFSLGFPYFVMMNNKYYAITTDHGIFILSNKFE